MSSLSDGSFDIVDPVLVVDAGESKTKRNQGRTRRFVQVSETRLIVSNLFDPNVDRERKKDSHVRLQHHRIIIAPLLSVELFHESNLPLCVLEGESVESFEGHGEEVRDEG